MFPIHDDTERMHGRPWLNYGMIGINVAVFVWQIMIDPACILGCQNGEMFVQYGTVPDILFQDPMRGAATIVTSMFMHGGGAHILGNMVFLFVFGDNIEDRYGRIKYLLIYLGWGAAAALAHSLYAVSVGGGNVPAVGASGAISGILGAYLVMYPRAKIFTILVMFFITTVRIPVLIYIPFWFGMQVLFQVLQLAGGGSDGVAYLAHIGGFVAGAATGLVWRLLPDSIKYKAGAPGTGTVFKPTFRKSRPRIEDVSPAIPEVIEGPDYYEVIAEVRGVSDAGDISTRYDPDSRQLRIVASGSRRYEIFAKLPDSAINPVVKYIQYLNGIARIRLAKE
ncbi:MAG TPA: rhomboid family intramembrane serine protease [Nitrososphaera sp.]|jgi:membrane associated rhomboid family serine protease|nr:rhomboid family intramembrane serine protease [Nitrososphaera sp.]